MEDSSGYGVIMFIDIITIIKFQNLYLEEREHMQKSLTPPYYRFNAALMVTMEVLFSIYVCRAYHRFLIN